jgi:hypothetical protein
LKKRKAIKNMRIYSKKVTVIDYIVAVLILVALVISILFNEIKIIALVIVISLVSVNIRDYLRKKRKTSSN